MVLYMGIYENNMLCMKENRPDLYELMEEVDLLKTKSRVDQVSSIQTYDGDQALVIRQCNQEYRINSLYSPTNEAHYWASQYKFQNVENIISLFGLGNGIFARELLNRLENKGAMFIYEPSSEVFFHVLHNYDIRDIIEHKYLILAVEDINTFDFHHRLMNSINVKNLRCQTICVHPMYDAIFQESCVWFWKELKDINIHAQININSLIAFGKRMIVNSLSNIKYLTNSNTILELKEIIPEGVPAIIVSAGPSVRNQIDYLKKAKGKAVIIAVDRIIDYLLDQGVEPDFVATIDPKKPVQYFTNRTDLTIPLMSFMESNYEIFDVHKGRKIICHCSDYLIDIYVKNEKTPPLMYTGTSVATLAFMAAVTLGFKTIILVGQDLAYDGSLSHAGSINESEDTHRDTLVEGIDGTQIRSRIDWKEFVVWYEDMIQLLPNVTVIDAKDKGAKIKGSIVMPLKEAVEQYCSRECHINIEDLDKTFDQEVFTSIRDYFKASIETLNKIKAKAKNAIKYCDLLLKEVNNKASKKAADNHRKLNNVINYIEKQPVYRLIDLYINASSAQNISELYEFDESSEDNELQTYKKSKELFEEILDAVDFINSRLEKSLEELNHPLNQNT